MKKGEMIELNINVSNHEIKNKIYNIRGMQVMLDRDLAVLYGVETRRLREQVNRNLNRFPDDFMFKLTEKEVEIMVSQNAIPSKKHLGGSFPFVFTEQGVANISSVLTNEKAVEVNIRIMRAFVEMRRFLNANALVFKRLDTVEKKQLEYDNKFEEIFNALEDKTNLPKQGIFFNGQIFDAYKFVADLIRKANKSIIIIDNYVDESVFLLLNKRISNVKTTIFTKNITKELLLDLKKYNSQYEKIEIKEFKESHDRFIILDEKEIYLLGSSLKDLGKKWFGFFKVEDISAFQKIKNLNI